MRAWRANELGDPWDVLRLEDDVPEPTPGPGEALLAVDATDLNFADILQVQGTYQVRQDPPFTPGLAATGTVLAVGAGADVAVGDRIVSTTVRGAGGYAERALVSGTGVTRVPDGVSSVDAAAMNVTYGTAWFSLHQRGHLQPGETVLVLAAAGGVGSAAVELARAHGCRVLAAAGGADKVQVCRDLGADVAIDYDGEDLYERVMAETDGRGVDVVYDPVGGDYFDIARRVVAWEGRLLVVGFASGRIPDAPANHVLVKNYSVVGVHMGGYRGRDEEPFARCYDEIFRLRQQGEIAPLIPEIIDLDDIPGALGRLARRETVGRVMLRVGDV